MLVISQNVKMKVLSVIDLSLHYFVSEEVPWLRRYFVGVSVGIAKARKGILWRKLVRLGTLC
jgi:hypothetical protein